MKKLSGIIVIALIIALLSAPMLLGRQAQGHIEQVVESLNNYPGYEANIKSYQRSWLTSTVEVELGIDVAQFNSEELAGLPSMTFKVLLAIDHGPVLLNDGVAVGLYAWRAGPAGETLTTVHDALALEGDEPFYRVWGKTSLLGETEFQDKARGFTLQTPELNADFSGYQGEGRVTRGGELSYQGAMTEASFSDGSSSASMRGLNAELAADLAHLDWRTMVYPGSMELTLEGAEFRTPFGGSGGLDALRVASDVELSDDGGAFDVVSEVSLDKVMGDAGAATDLKIVMSLVNVDLDAYRAYLDAYTEVMQAASADAATPEAPDFSKMFNQEVMQQFVARGPEIRIDELAFTVPQGTMEADLAMTFDKESEVPEQEMIMFWLMTAVSVNANAELDRPLAEMFAQLGAAAQGMTPGDGSDPGVDMLNMMIAQGIFTESDGKIKTELNMADGSFTVNGQPFPLGAMMQ
ncbi:DUF945 family protein [Gilvimarinus sp. SDUM040013]|uniref:DUF945 family protein n=1 Tax=Gilvimarinus gilvus TaxID=3058038 RepID=A0ABU4S2F0_9GAMM|nr:DUF945 family protein [Gilvimarinus sp. SDUM040013]MDO3384947.1 DUF945 family protein [Gilvimarinus sp. SDUM040013]MDX6851257.1 DUF945 family protein [Gilvimarinus sp. SDUM040013]